MRRMILLAGLVLAVGILLPASARPAVGGTDLPFKSSFTGTSTLNLQTGQVHNVSIGTASHFGLALIEQDGYLIPDLTRPGTFNLVTSLTSTAANGDQMFGGCAGPVTTTDGVHFLLSVDCSAGSGTGRLAQASLNMTVTAVSTRVSVEGGFATQHVEGTAEGLLSHQGSDQHQAREARYLRASSAR